MLFIIIVSKLFTSARAQYSGNAFSANANHAYIAYKIPIIIFIICIDSRGVEDEKLTPSLHVYIKY